MQDDEPAASHLPAKSVANQSGLKKLVFCIEHALRRLIVFVVVRYGDTAWLVDCSV